MDRNKEDKNAYVFLWNVEHFKHCMFTGTPEFQSPYFTAFGLDKILWNLSVRPPCDLSDNLEISIQRINIRNKVLSGKCEFSILALDGSIFYNEKVTLEGDGRVIVPNSEEIMRRKCLLLPAGTLTIRCRLWQTENVEGSVYIYAYSRVIINCQMAVKAVEKVSSLSLGKIIKIPFINVRGDMYTHPMVEVYLEGPTLSDSCVCVRVMMKKIIQRTFLSSKISIMDVNSTKVLKSVKEGQWLDTDHSNILFHIITRQELLQRQDLLTNDVLNLQFKFITSNGVECGCIERTFYEPTTTSLRSMQDRWALPKATCQCDSPNEYHCINNQKTCAPFRTLLQNEFQLLYKDKIQANWELRTGGVSFPVHKCVLCARSPVFRAMFDSNMVETSADFLNIPDIESDTVGRMLLFLYTDAIDDNLGWETIAKLYYAADKYQILSLKQKCASYLTACLCVSNVCDILLLADRHNDEILKSSVHDFIFKNEKKVIESDEWRKFRNVNGEMANTIMLEGDKNRHRVKRCKKW